MEGDPQRLSGCVPWSPAERQLCSRRRRVETTPGGHATGFRRPPPSSDTLTDASPKDTVEFSTRDFSKPATHSSPTFATSRRTVFAAEHQLRSRHVTAARRGRAAASWVHGSTAWGRDAGSRRGPRAARGVRDAMRLVLEAAIGPLPADAPFATATSFPTSISFALTCPPTGWESP